MSVVLVVFVAGLIAALLLALVSGRRRSTGVPLDPERSEERVVWFVATHWRLHRTLTHFDRRVVGGATVVVALTALWAAGLFVGWVLDTIDSNRGFARWDESVAEWGSEHATTTSTDILSVITRFGETLYLLALMAVIGGIDWVRRRNPDVLLFLASVGIGISLVNNAIKWVVLRDRPLVDHLVGSGGSSFPSGHSAAAAACWAAIALVLGRSLQRRGRLIAAAGAVGLAVLVAASRALLGVHWLTDVVAGVVVGWAWFFLVAVMFGGRFQRLGEPVERATTVAPIAHEASRNHPGKQEVGV